MVHGAVQAGTQSQPGPTPPSFVTGLAAGRPLGLVRPRCGGIAGHRRAVRSLSGVREGRVAVRPTDVAPRTDLRVLHGHLLFSEDRRAVGGQRCFPCAGQEPDARPSDDLSVPRAARGPVLRAIDPSRPPRGRSRISKVGTLAIDGTKVKANASKHKAMSYERMQEEEERLKREIHAIVAACGQCRPGRGCRVRPRLPRR